ncbi:MAG: hypothetical protein HKN45_02230 [Flavobacteriales bacterium]|nr:hypothetical protein [Flavobacteriales bacterium]
MKWISGIALIVLVGFYSCESETIEEEPVDVPNFELQVGTNFQGQPVELYEYYENVVGDRMNFEQILLYLSDISLIKSNGDTVYLSEIDLFDLDGPDETRTYDVPVGDYVGLVYHVGVPKRLNSMDNPDFMISIYGPDSPLNVQNGMYWAWATGYRFLIYEGRLDTTPQNPNDIPSFYSIHLGKDTLYTQIEVDFPFTVNDDDTRSFKIDWDLSRCIYDNTDTLNLRDPLESQFHGEDNELGFRFQSFLENAFDYSVE